MIDNILKDEMLKSIALSGAADAEKAKDNHLILNSRNNLNHIAGVSSGQLRIYPSMVNRFKLTLSQPSSLAILNPFEIRCVLCKGVISYPCWYYNIKYAINHFHFFICFDSGSPNKPTTSCYRRDI